MTIGELFSNRRPQPREKKPLRERTIRDIFGGSVPFVIILVICFLFEMLIVGYLTNMGIIDTQEIKRFWIGLFD
jgi:hypothetical protein